MEKPKIRALATPNPRNQLSYKLARVGTRHAKFRSDRFSDFCSTNMWLWRAPVGD